MSLSQIKNEIITIQFVIHSLSLFLSICVSDVGRTCGIILAVGCLVNWCSAIEVNCVDKLSKRISIFNATENHTNPYQEIHFDIPDHECFIDQPITLDENDTLSIVSTNYDQITSITFAQPSTSPGFPLVIFTTFPNLSDVHVISAGIEVIVEDDFVNATALKRLRLELNIIKRISNKAFAQPINLETLELPANGIQEIDNYAFATLLNLTKLNLQQNNLTTIREFLFSGVDNLMEIYLNDNQIEYIEDGALYLPKLSRIFLQDNRLKSLSANLLTGAPSLFGIDLGRNRLESVQDVFDKCGNLTIIGLNHNQIKSIDFVELADMPSLHVLSLEGNRLQFDANHTADERKNLIPFKTHLEYLNLDSNNLSSPAILKELNVFHRLKFLDLDDNKLTKIDEFKEIRVFFPHFIQINMNENPLSCAWLEDAWPFIENTGIVFQTLEIDSEEDKDNEKNNKFSGSNRKKVNGITCNIEEPPSQHIDDTAIPSTDETNA